MHTAPIHYCYGLALRGGEIAELLAKIVNGRTLEQRWTGTTYGPNNRKTMKTAETDNGAKNRQAKRCLPDGLDFESLPLVEGKRPWPFVFPEQAGAT